MALVLELRKVNATSFRFNVACGVNDAMRAELEALFGKPPAAGKGRAFGVLRKRGEYEWVDFAHVEYLEEGGPHLHATFIYGLSDVPPPPRSVPKPHKLLQILSMADEPLVLSCNISFLYEESAERSTIRLPISIFRTEKAGSYEIRGLEVARTEPPELNYNIRISLRQDQSIAHDVKFGFESKARPGIEGYLLKQAKRISQEFLES